MKRPQPNQSNPRRGAVAVEFAVISPMLLAIVLGLVEVNRIYETQNLLEMGAREGARYASINREGLNTNGLSGNQKITLDVLNFLEANGLPREGLTVEVKDHQSPGQDFDIDDPDNELRLFSVQVSVDYSDVSFTPVKVTDDFALGASVTFRNGPATHLSN